MPVTIVLADDHRIVRDGLKLLLESEADLRVTGEAADTESAWSTVTSLQPDVVITDAEMPGEGGIKLTERIRQTYPAIKVIFLTAHAQPQYVQGAIVAGATGYLLKTSAGNELVAAVRAALKGQTYLCAACSTILVSQYQKQLDPAEKKTLSARERDVLVRISNGASTKEIAFALGVSAKTVETHRANLMAKLNLNSIAELTKYAVREGFSEL